MSGKVWWSMTKHRHVFNHRPSDDEVRYGHKIFFFLAIVVLPVLWFHLSSAVETGKSLHLDRGARNGSFVYGREGTIWLVPHSHYDVAWLDPEDKTASRIAMVYRDHVLTAMTKPSYRFVLDQVPSLRAFALLFPAMMSDLIDLVKQGRAQLVGGMFVQPDENLPEGETLLQAGVLGQRYLEETFGVRSRSGFNIDSFGHSLQMPQILRQAGMKEFVFARLGDAPRPSKTEFWWVAPDGSRVLTAWMAEGYDVAQGIGRSDNLRQEQGRILAIYRKLRPLSATSHVLIPVGGDYAPPPIYLPEIVADWNARNEDIKMNIATVSDFFDAVLSTGEKLPEVSWEFNRVFPGAYSARIWIKQRHRAAEHRLLQAERLATLASLYAGYNYPETKLRTAWEHLVVNTFHDLLPATSVDGVYGGMERRYEEAEQIVSHVARASAEALVQAAGYRPWSEDSKSLPTGLVLFNTLNYDRREMVRIRVPIVSGQPRPFRLLDEKGREVVYQVLTPVKHYEDEFRVPSQEGAWMPGFSHDESSLEIAFVAEVPSMGFTVYRLEWGKVPSQSPEEIKVSFHSSRQETFEVRTQSYTARFDKGGNLTALLDSDGKAWILRKPEDPEWLCGNLVEVHEDRSNAYFPYEGGRLIATTANLPAQGIILRGPVLTRVIFTTQLPDGTLIREVNLPERTKLISFITSLEWRGKHAVLRVLMPTTAQGETAQEIPYGFTTDRRPGRWPVMKWVDTSNEESGGVALFNRGLPDHEVHGGLCWLTLMRSIDYTFFRPGDSPNALGQGRHRFEYALMPHKRGWRRAGVVAAAWAYSEPLIATLVSGKPVSKRTAQGKLSFLRTSENIIVVAIRREGVAVLVRTLETRGERAVAELRWFGLLPLKSVEPVNTLGDRDRVESLQWDGRVLRWQTRPQGINTWRWSLRRY